ncbi:MAG: hypothetical protein L3J56_08190 [Bacteroidales bacterium]|nr:hypothetical protein [Bacteroidales bacterium]
MNELFEISKYILPLIVLLVAVMIILNHFAKKEKLNLKYDIIKANNKLITPIRLQAYERIILFLERIRPDALALRLTKPGMTAKQLQLSMLSAVRNEFNHNLAQQIYLTDETWTAVIYAKEQIARLINLTGSKIDPNLKSNAFTAVLIDSYNEIDTKPVETCVGIVKNEAAQFFGI